jgi:hypothetical protein
MNDKKLVKSSSKLAAKLERVVADGPLETLQKPRKSSARAKDKLKSYMMDLRIHSPASLGYFGIEGIDTAPALVRLAKVKGLDVIAVTDFYSGHYIDRIVHAARDTNLTIIPGVVIRCALKGCADVTLCCLFPEEANTDSIETFLISLGIPRESFGDESYVVKLPFEEVIKLTDSHGALVMPSRMDKTPHRKDAITALVEDYGFRAFDLAYPDSAVLFKDKWPKIKFSLFSFSNANALAQVGSRSAKIKMEIPGFQGLKQIVARDTSYQDLLHKEF